MPEFENDLISDLCKPLPEKLGSLFFLASRIHPLGVISRRKFSKPDPQIAEAH